MTRPHIIDADSHITEPPDVWTSRVPVKYVEQVPHVETTESGLEVWVLDGVRIATVGRTAPAGWPEFPHGYPPRLADCHPASYDAKARLEYLDSVGIWAQVLYPNVAGFGAQRFLDMKDEQLKIMCVQAYNDFLHEWTSADPNRLIALVSTPFWDIDATVAEVERCAALGFRGVLFSGEPQRFGHPPLESHHWDPLWSVAQDAGLPIHFHIGGGEDTNQEGWLHQPRTSPNAYAAAAAYVSVDLYFKNGLQCADLICSGVLERYPELKFVTVESGIGWIPFMLEAVDYAYLGVSQTGRRRTEGLLPSELFHRQVYATYWFEQAAPAHLLDVIPVDHVLFETDFPHTACLYENIDETIERGLSGVAPDVRQKILFGNAAKLYGIEGPAEMDRAAR